MTIPDHKEVTADLLDKFNYFDSYRTQYIQRALNSYKLYKGWKDDKIEGRSNLHIPRTYEIVDTLRARLVKAFFGTRPYIDFTPMPGIGGNPWTLQLNEQKAKVAAANLDRQLEINNIPIKWYKFITDLLIFPTAIMGVGWKYQREPVKRRVKQPEVVQHPYYGYVYTGRMVYVMQESIETVWDDNEIVNIDFMDFWPEPQGIDIDSCRGVFQREWITWEDLQQKISYLAQLGEGKVFPVNLNELQGTNGSLDEGRWEKLGEVGISAGNYDVYSRNHDARNRKKEMFELLHYWEDDRHSILINRTECIYDGRNPYWRHRKKPFVTSSFELMGDEFYGISAVEIIADLQHELNSRRNQIMDNVNLLINRMFLKRRGADIDDSDLISRPNAVIEVDDVERDIRPLEMGDMKNSAWMSLNMENQQMDNTLAADSIVRGATTSKSQTATEVMTKNTNASTRFDIKIMLYESLGVKRLAYLMDLNNQQFITEDRLVKISDGDVEQWQMVTPDDFMGEFDYRPTGTSVDPSANKEVRREQLTNMIQFLMQSGVSFVNWYALIKAWMESFDIRNPQKFLIPPEAMQQQMMMQNGVQGVPPAGGMGTPANVPQQAVTNLMQGVREGG